MGHHLISAEGHIKNKLFQIYIRGGLKHNLQRLIFYYYPPTQQFSPKLVLEMAMVNPEGVEAEPPFSIRFDNFFDVQEVIKGLQMGKVMLGKKIYQVTPHNVDFRIREDIKMITESYKEKNDR